MKFAECYAPGRFGLSMELFPPKTPKGMDALMKHVERLMDFAPDIVTCTYGAGGSTRDRTLEVAQQVHRRFGVSVAAHLTLVGSTVEQLRSFLQEAWERGIENIVALRGDPPRDQQDFRPVPGGLRYANELVELIRREFPQFGVAVAGYPETHQEAPSPEADLQNLLRKVQAGADVVITQLFYDNQDFFRFRQRAQEVGVRVPIVPGLLPILNLAQVKRITSLCGAKLPQELIEQMGRYEDGSPEQFRLGVEFAVRQVQELVDQGVPGLHFYVLNRSEAASAILSQVKLPRAGAKPSP